MPPWDIGYSALIVPRAKTYVYLIEFAKLIIRYQAPTYKTRVLKLKKRETRFVFLKEKSSVKGAGLERMMGIEPTYLAWEANVLPLNYTRM